MQGTAKQRTQPDDFLSALEGLIIIDPLLLTPYPPPPPPQSIVKNLILIIRFQYYSLSKNLLPAFMSAV